jgi:hypothetical protein
MKHFLFIVFIFVSIQAIGQVGLKGLNIGEKIKDDRSVITSTVGGIPGKIWAFSLEDGTIFKLWFLPNGNMEISHTQLEPFIDAVSYYFNVDLKSHNDAMGFLYAGSIVRNGRTYIFKISGSSITLLKYIMKLSIYDKDLLSQHKHESNSDAFNDF